MRCFSFLSLSFPDVSTAVLRKPGESRGKWGHSFSLTAAANHVPSSYKLFMHSPLKHKQSSVLTLRFDLYSANTLHSYFIFTQTVPPISRLSVSVESFRCTWGSFAFSVIAILCHYAKHAQWQYNCSIGVLCFFSIFPLCSPVWFFSSRPRTPEGRARYSFLFLCRYLFYLLVVSCKFTAPALPVRLHLRVAVRLLQRAGVGVGGWRCVCVFGAEGCTTAWHVPHLTFVSLSLCPCVSSASFHPGLCVLHNCVLLSLPQQTSSDTVHCVGAGMVGMGWKKQGSSGVGLGVDKEITGIWGDSSEEKEAYLG